MYVCVCNAVTESALKAAVCSGVRDLDGLQARTGCGSGCGCCRELAAQLIVEHAATIDAPTEHGGNVLPFRQVA